MAFTVKPLQIFWQKFHRNVPWVVLYQADDSSARYLFFELSNLGKNACSSYNS